MNEDIVTRLREGSRYRVLDGEAADEIERLRASARVTRDSFEVLRLEIIKLHKDRERLDWMIEALACVRWTHAPAAEAIVEYDDGESRVHVDLRDAIDAAKAKVET